MRRSVRLSFGLVLLCGLALVAWAGIRQERVDVQRLGVLAELAVADLRPGAVACENRVGLADPVSRIGFDADASGSPSPALDARIRSHRGHHTLATGHLDRGWGGGPLVIRTGSVDTDELVDVCLRNAGPYRVQLFGDVPGHVVPHVAPASTLTVNGKEVPGDLSLRFVRPEPVPALALVPSMLRHAAVLRPFGAWGMWVLLVAVLIGLPLLLWRALSGALRAPPE